MGSTINLSLRKHAKNYKKKKSIFFQLNYDNKDLKFRLTYDDFLAELDSYAIR